MRKLLTRERAVEGPSGGGDGDIVDRRMFRERKILILRER